MCVPQSSELYESYQTMMDDQSIIFRKAVCVLCFAFTNYTRQNRLRVCRSLFGPSKNGPYLVLGALC